MENTSNQEKTSFFDRKFGFTAKGSSLKTEIVAGITTFLAMAYILIVNAGMFNDLSNVSFDAIYVTTAISAIVGTVLIGLLANLPLAQAPGMGLNAFFVTPFVLLSVSLTRTRSSSFFSTVSSLFFSPSPDFVK